MAAVVGGLGVGEWRLIVGGGRGSCAGEMRGGQWLRRCFPMWFGNVTVVLGAQVCLAPACAQILSLGRNAIKKIEGLNEVCDTLEQLWVSYNAIGSFSGIEKLVNLTVLYASNNKIDKWPEVRTHDQHLAPDRDAHQCKQISSTRPHLAGVSKSVDTVLRHFALFCPPPTPHPLYVGKMSVPPQSDVIRTLRWSGWQRCPSCVSSTW